MVLTRGKKKADSDSGSKITSNTSSSLSPNVDFINPFKQGANLLAHGMWGKRRPSVFPTKYNNTTNGKVNKTRNLCPTFVLCML